MQKVTLFHNNRCSKSREALALLEAEGISPEIRYYLESPPTPEELKALLGKLHMKAEDLVRKNEPLYKEKYEGRKISEARWLKILSENPVLIERPVVIHGRKAVVARPPEKALEVV